MSSTSSKADNSRRGSYNNYTSADEDGNQSDRNIGSGTSSKGEGSSNSSSFHQGYKFPVKNKRDNSIENL